MARAGVRARAAARRGRSRERSRIGQRRSGGGGSREQGGGSGRWRARRCDRRRGRRFHRRARCRQQRQSGAGGQGRKQGRNKDAKQQQGAGKDKDAKSAKAGKGAKASKEAKNAPQDNKDVTVLTQSGAPQQSAEQIVANSDSYIERIKTELNLTSDQEKHWYGFSSAMHYLGHNGAERLNLRVARAKRDPPDDIIEQMRNEAQFLIDRAADQRNVADAAEPLYSSLDDKQKQVFIQEMVRLSHERGLD